MFVDQQSGKRKVPKKGQCIICNQPEEVKSALGKIAFCRSCFAALKDEKKLSKRIVWD